MSQNHDESWEYVVELTRFRIIQTTNSRDGRRDTLVVNPYDTLYFESMEPAKSDSLGHSPHLYGSGWDMETLKRQISQRVGRDVYRSISPSESDSLSGGVVQGIGLGFFMPSETLFGLGEREDTLVLKRTTGSRPYEMWAYDV